MSQSRDATVLGSPETLVLTAPPLVPHLEQLSAPQLKSLIDAAAYAGFGGLSIWTVHHDWALEDGMTSDEYFAYHRDRGLDIATSQVLTEWATVDPQAISDANTHVLDVSARSGAPFVIAITLAPELPALSDAASGLAQLCDLAADRGLAVSFEFLPFTAIPTIADAARLLDAVDRDNLGLVIDVWHWLRQPRGPDIPTLRTIPPERIHLLQLTDAPSAPAENPMMETFTARLLPGQGDGDLLGLIEALSEMGATPIVASEVFSTRLAELGPAEFARLQYEAMRGILEQHWSAAAAK
jgi:sugar phosphate isomerase/epimerase